MNWRHTGGQLPKAGEPVLCAWKVNDPHPGAVNGWLYGVAAYSTRYWHGPEDDANDFCEPMYWQEIELPDEQQGRSAADCRAHNPEVGGSNPPPASTSCKHEHGSGLMDTNGHGEFTCHDCGDVLVLGRGLQPQPT